MSLPAYWTRPTLELRCRLNKLYTIGYQGLRGVYQLLNMVIPLDATIIDIRYSPWSRDERWTQESLLERLCRLQFGGLATRYVHIKELGNVNYNRKGEPIEIWLPEVGIDRLTMQLEAKPCVLLCVCQDFERCHRSVVAELAERWIEGCEVEHLTPASPVPACRGGVRPEGGQVEVQTVKRRPVAVEQGQLSLF